MTSPFLSIAPTQYIARNILAFAVFDRFPVSPGHALIIPFRHVATWFDATRLEQESIFALVDLLKKRFDQGVLFPDGSTHTPDGYNVGFNAGETAGQTVMHLHVHLIPRYRGDMHDPRGGVRHVIPEKGNYLKPNPKIPDANEKSSTVFSSGFPKDSLMTKISPLFDQADQIAIVAAFVREPGLRCIQENILRAVSRGARVQVLTGDYLGITQPSALEMLLDWSSATRATTTDNDPTETPSTQGTLEARVIETQKLPKGQQSFHPKSWRFERSADCWGVAFVGSSNLSRSALCAGIEWNLGITRVQEPDTFDAIKRAFQNLWQNARALDAAWIETYAARVHSQPPLQPQPEDDPTHSPHHLHAPHQIQKEALDALRASRAQGKTRALVVLATGLGKTLLATLDFAQLAAELNKTPKLLFIAHRRELLLQAAEHYRTLSHTLPSPLRIGWCMEDSSDLGADAVFASVAKLARSPMLKRLREQTFDYVVIDEVHHAHAPSYRRIIDALNTTFLLGLTATPERADANDILGLFHDLIAYRADIPRGIASGFLVPFAYHGIKDDIDYTNIPWRNKRFDPDALAKAAQTQARMTSLLRALQKHPGTRTLIFCCSVEHALFVKTWLIQQYMRVEAVFSDPRSDDRETVLQKLRANTIDAVCSVDMFNEGIDVREVDRVVMLRPTESNVIFLQQLGRGLRVHPNKTALTVIDFVGNHRLFLDRINTLLSATRAAAEDARSIDQLRLFLNDDAPLSLPSGCSVDLELEAKHLLERLFQSHTSAADTVERAYKELRIAYGRRPSAGELFRSGYDPMHLSNAHDGWFHFVAKQQDLTDEQESVAATAQQLLRSVERTEMSKCLKMVLLEAFLELDGLNPSGVALPDLCARSWDVLSRSQDLLAEVPEQHRPTTSPATDKTWRAYWRKNPIEAWTSAKKDRSAEMRLLDNTIFLDSPLTETQRPILADLLRELVDYRLTKYRSRFDKKNLNSNETFICKIIQNPSAAPILKLPTQNHSNIPKGEHDVRLQNGSVWRFRFAKEFCNVARPVNTEKNQLAELLRGWFGPTVGAAGTRFQVRFSQSPDGLWIEPLIETHTQGAIQSKPHTLNVGDVVNQDELASAFGIESLTLQTGRASDHVFCFIDRADILISPTEIAIPGVSLRQGESAFVFALRDPNRWQYLGVGHQQPGASAHHLKIPEVHFDVWRAWGKGRTASRALPDEALGEARRLVDLLLSIPEAERKITNPSGQTAFVRTRTASGGFCIDGGLGGFEPRNVSTTDLAWVIETARDIQIHGGLLDETRVNRLRYLEGTPRASTRWIDTGWAIAAYKAVTNINPLQGKS